MRNVIGLTPLDLNDQDAVHQTNCAGFDGSNYDKITDSWKTLTQHLKKVCINNPQQYTPFPR
jgi:hypothetical protein